MRRTAGQLFLSGFRLRCPYCGKGKLFRKGFKMYEKCPECGWYFEREEGYWTGAMAINLVVAEFIVVGIGMPLAIWLAFAHVPIAYFLIVGLPLTVLVPLLFFRHSKSFWMSIDFMLHLPEPEEEPT